MISIKREDLHVKNKAALCQTHVIVYQCGNLILALITTKIAPLNKHYPKLQCSTYLDLVFLMGSHLYLFMKVSFIPDVIPRGMTGLKTPVD